MSARDDYRRFRDGFAEALDARFYPIEWLDQRIHWDATVRLFCSDAAAAVVELKSYPSGARAVHVICGAGDLRELVGLVPAISQWADENGAAHFFVDSREAWQRLLEPLGFNTYKISVMRAL